MSPCAGIQATPGPWIWDGYALRPADPRPEESAVHTILEMETFGRGFLMSDHTATATETELDLLLIQHAPGLLATLRHLVHRRDRLTQEDWARAEAAIADATTLSTDFERGRFEWPGALLSRRDEITP